MSRFMNPLTPGGLPTPQMPGSVADSELPEEMKLALKMRRDALGGFSSEENAALRGQMAAERQSGESARKRALAQSLAKNGVRGGAAVAAQGRQQQLAAQEQAQQAQDLFVKNIAQKQAALGNFEQTASGGLKTIQNQQFMSLAAQLAAKQMELNKQIADQQAAATEKYGWLSALGQQDDDESRRVLRNYYANLRPGAQPGGVPYTTTSSMPNTRNPVRDRR